MDPTSIILHVSDGRLGNLRLGDLCPWWAVNGVNQEQQEGRSGNMFLLSCIGRREVKVSEGPLNSDPWAQKIE